MLTAVTSLPQSLDPEMAKLLAARFALSLARNMGYLHVVLEMDCLSGVQAINSSYITCLSSSGILVQDI